MKQNLIDPKKTALLCDFSHDETFTKIVELTAIPFPTSQWTPADVTTLDDIAKRLAAAGFIDNGSVEIRGLMVSGSSQQAQLFVINRTKACHRYKIVLSDPLHTTMEFDAFITNWAPSNTVGDKARVAFNLSIDGDVKFYNNLGVIWDGMAGDSGSGEEPQISCAGATDYMGFERLAGDWDVYVDGVFYPSPYSPAVTIRNELDEIIEAQDDGFADFWSRDTVPHRIKFVPKNTEENPNSYILREENTNQSFAELADGSLVFCLSAAESGDCTPQNLVIPPHTFPLANYLVDYQVNGGAIERWTLNLDKFANPDLPSWLLFSMIVFGNPGQPGIQVPDGTFSSGDGSGSFLFDGNTITGTVSANALLGTMPITIKFFSVIDQPNDPIQTLFSTDEITIHACGQQHWP